MLSKFKRLQARASAFFFKPDTSNYQFLVFFRISISLLALLHFLSVWPDFQAMFGKYGIIPADVQEIMGFPFQISLPDIITFFEGWGMSEGTTIVLFQVTFIVAALALCFGFLTRGAAALLLFLQLAMIHGADLYVYGVDNFTTSSLFYLILFPAGRFYSLDQRLWPHRGETNLTPYRRVFQLHVCMVYFFAGLSKSLGPNWWNGEAIWKSMHLPGANDTFDLNLSILADYPWMAMLLGCSILAIETLYPIFVWIPRTRKAWVLLTVGMHLGIGFVLGLYFFAAIMIFWNLTAFYFVQGAFAESKSRITLRPSHLIPAKENERQLG